MKRRVAGRSAPMDRAKWCVKSARATGRPMALAESRLCVPATCPTLSAQASPTRHGFLRVTVLVSGEVVGGGPEWREW